MSGSMRTSPIRSKHGTKHGRSSKAAQKEALKLAKREAEKDDPESQEQNQTRPQYRPSPVLEPLPGCVKKVAGYGKGSAAQQQTAMTQLGYEELTRLHSLGRSTATIAHRLGISVGMYHTLKDSDEQMRAAIALGTGQYEDRYSDALMRMAEMGNIAAAIWVEKTRFGKRDNTAVEQSTKHVHIHLPDSVSPADYMASLARVHADTHAKALADHPDSDTSTKRPLIETSWIPSPVLDVLTEEDALRAQIADVLAPTEFKVLQPADLAKLRQQQDEPAEEPPAKRRTPSSRDVER